MNDNNLVIHEIREKVDILYEIGKKLLGKTTKSKAKSFNNSVNSTINYQILKDSLLDIEKINSPQAKGYAFEKYLNKLFKEFDLEPNASYRTEHDQIDGSFRFDGNTVLIEAKYKTNEISKDDLILFENKLKSKSHFTKGLLITYSKITNKALDYFRDSGSRIVVLTVEEIFLLCENQISLLKVLQNKYRQLDEKGLIFCHIMGLNLYY